MNPIKNVFTACEGTLVNGSVGWTKKRQSWKSGDETPVETAILNVLNPVLSFGDCSTSLLTQRKTETLKLIMSTLS